MAGRSRTFWLKYLVVTALVSCFLMEIVVRLLGYTAWNPDTRVNIIVEPGGKLFQLDSLLGYKHLPGEFHVALPTGLEFDLTHGENTLRITRPSDSYLEDKPRPEIWIFGGSFVHGWSLNDDETFAWILQDQFPEVDLINFGVGGYGTIQTMLALNKLIKGDRRADLIIVAYSALHDERNTLLRSRVKEVYAWNHLGDMSQPAARIDGDSLVISHRRIAYTPVPFIRYSALAHCVDLAINKIEHRLVDSHAVTRAILRNIVTTADEAAIPVLFAHIYEGPDSRELMDWAHEQGFDTLDIAVNLSDPGMSNRPFDAHPSALANEHYAAGLTAYVREMVAPSK